MATQNSLEFSTEGNVCSSLHDKCKARFLKGLAGRPPARARSDRLAPCRRRHQCPSVFRQFRLRRPPRNRAPRPTCPGLSSQNERRKSFHLLFRNARIEAGYRLFAGTRAPCRKRLFRHSRHRELLLDSDPLRVSSVGIVCRLPQSSRPVIRSVSGRAYLFGPRLQKMSRGPVSTSTLTLLQVCELTLVRIPTPPIH